MATFMRSAAADVNISYMIFDTEGHGSIANVSN